MEAKDLALQGLNEAQAALMLAVDGLTQQELMWQPQPGANHIAFTLWHVLRVEDWFFQYLFQRVPQVWEAERWHEKMNLPEDPRVNGFGYTAEQVDSFPPIQPGDILGYAEAVRARTLEYVRNLDPAKFDEVVQSRAIGDASIGTWISHLLIEIAQHIGQIAFIKGLAQGQGK